MYVCLYLRTYVHTYIHTFIPFPSRLAREREPGWVDMHTLVPLPSLFTRKKESSYPLAFYEEKGPMYACMHVCMYVHIYAKVNECSLTNVVPFPSRFTRGKVELAVRNSVQNGGFW